MHNGCVCIVLGLLFASPGFPQDEARDLLATAGATYRSLKSCQFEGTTLAETKTGSGVTKLETKFVFALAKPDKARLELDYATAGTWLRTTDGANYYEFRSITDQKSKRKARPDDLDVLIRASVMGRYQRIDEQVQGAKLLADESVQVGGSPVDCRVLEVRYSTRALFEGMEQIPTKYWIDKQRHLVLRQEAGTRSDRAGQVTENRRTTLFTVARVNETVPDSLFQPNP